MPTSWLEDTKWSTFMLLSKSSSQGHTLGIQQNNQSVCQAPSYPSFRYTVDIKGKSLE